VSAVESNKVGFEFQEQEIFLQPFRASSIKPYIENSPYLNSQLDNYGSGSGQSLKQCADQIQASDKQNELSYPSFLNTSVEKPVAEKPI
jgi:hypothetical protein